MCDYPPPGTLSRIATLGVELPYLELPGCGQLPRPVPTSSTPLRDNGCAMEGNLDFVRSLYVVRVWGEFFNVLQERGLADPGLTE